MPQKIVVYTAAFGPSIKLMPQQKFSGVDFICFSNTNRSTKGWNIKTAEPHFINDYTRSNRYYKINPHLFFKDYDYSIYIDANIIVMQSPIPLLQKLDVVHLLTFDHNQTAKDKRNSIYEEYEALMRLTDKSGNTKDEPAVMTQQIQMFRANDYPGNNGLIKACVLIRKHNEPDVIKTMEDWWWFIVNLSKRDQLSFNYVAWKNKFSFGYLKGDARRNNNWFYMAAKTDKSIGYTLLKYKLRKWLKRI